MDPLNDHRWMDKWVGSFGVYFPSRPEMNVTDFIPVGELQTIGRAKLRAVPRALNEVTMLRPASIMCDSKYIMDGCNGHAMKWKRDEWRTASRPVKHTDLWKQILILLEVYATHVTVHHVPSHVGLAENKVADRLAGEGRLRSPLWTLNTTLLNFTLSTLEEELDVQFLSARAVAPPPQSREHNDFVPWSPQSVVLMFDKGSPRGKLESPTTTPVKQIIPRVYQVDTPSPWKVTEFYGFRCVSLMCRRGGLYR